jgi:hypothetical protein
VYSPAQRSAVWLCWTRAKRDERSESCDACGQAGVPTAEGGWLAALDDFRNRALVSWSLLLPATVSVSTDYARFKRSSFAAVGEYSMRSAGQLLFREIFRSTTYAVEVRYCDLAAFPHVIPSDLKPLSTASRSISANASATVADECRLLRLAWSPRLDDPERRSLRARVDLIPLVLAGAPLQRSRTTTDTRTHRLRAPLPRPRAVLTRPRTIRMISHTPPSAAVS